MAATDSWDRGPVRVQPLRHRQGRFRAFQSARRHSRWVRRLRLLLPVAGIVMIAGFAVATHFGLPENLDLSAARLSVTSNGIVMEHPNLTGFDQRNREYSVVAERAVQALSKPNEVHLDAIVARLGTQDAGLTTITAQSGDFDRIKNTMKLHGAIRVDSSEGISVDMTDADIDFAAGTMSSPNATTLTQGAQTTTGQRIAVSEGGKVIRLEGGVRTDIEPSADMRADAAVPPQDPGIPAGAPQ